MTDIEAYIQHVHDAKESLDAAITILEKYDLHYGTELKKSILIIDLTQKQYVLIQKQVSLSGWLKGMLGWKK